jgi:hypothetical protein
MLILSKNVPPFVKTEVLLSCSQDPDDEPYPAEDQSSPRTQSLFICFSILIELLSSDCTIGPMRSLRLM